MNQSAQCLNCETIFDTPGVALGKTAIVLCPRCKKAVVVKGQVDPQDAAPTGPIAPGPDRTGPVPRPVADRTVPLPRPVPDRTGPVSIPGLDRLDRTGPVHTGPIPTGPIETPKVKEEDSHAWRTRPISERPIVDREKKVDEPAPKPTVAAKDAAPWKVVAMGLFTTACVGFMFFRVFYTPPPDAQTLARIEANENAFLGVVPITEDGVSVAVITDAYARAFVGAQERDICMNAIFHGVMAAKIRTESGKPVADCSPLLRGRN
jgi:hypothetical protein